MIESLPLFHRISGQPVIVLGSGDVAEARRRLVERAGGVVVDDLQEGIDKGARLAFVAHIDEAFARADALRLRCSGILVNVADRPELCDFTMPSILDRAPVLVAIGTGGASAGLAKALRLRLEALLPASLGLLATGLGRARAALRLRFPDAGERRRVLDEALAQGGALDPLDASSADRIEGWLDGAPPAPPDTVELRIAGDDPDGLTLRQARLLGSADVVVHEPGVSPAILERARADAARVVIAPGDPAPAIAGLVIVLRD